MRRWRTLLQTSLLCGVLTTTSAIGTAHGRSAPSGTSPAPLVGVAAFRGQGQLAFLWSGRSYLLDGDRGALHALPGTAATAPTWSADGRWLAYLASNGGTTGSALWVVRKDGGNAHTIAGLPAAAHSYAWSSRGHTLDVTLDKRTAANLWFADPTGQAGPHPVASRVGLLSPDGATLAFTALLSYKDPTQRSEVLYTVPVSGGRPVRRLTARYSGIILLGWWPDGKGLLYRLDPQFSASMAADGLPLYTLRLGAAPRALPVTLGYPEYMAPSPSGRRVLLVAGGDRENWNNKSLRICAIETAACHALPKPPVQSRSTPIGRRAATASSTCRPATVG